MELLGLEEDAGGFLQDNGGGNGEGGSIINFLNSMMMNSDGSPPVTDHTPYGSESDKSICTSSDYVVFRAMEFGLKIIPSILFFILGSMRYCKIKDIGQGRVIYSLHFKFKFCISAIMGSAYIIYVFVCWAQTPDASHSSWINICEDDYFVVFYAA